MSAYPHDGRCEHNAMTAYSERCTAPATRRLEWELDGKNFGPDYLCAYHAGREASLILGGGGSPRIGNL